MSSQQAPPKRKKTTTPKTTEENVMVGPNGKLADSGGSVSQAVSPSDEQVDKSESDSTPSVSKLPKIKTRILNCHSAFFTDLLGC